MTHPNALKGWQPIGDVQGTSSITTTVGKIG